MQVEVKNQKVFIDGKLVTDGVVTAKNRFNYLLVGFIVGALSMLAFVIAAQNITL